MSTTAGTGTPAPNADAFVAAGWRMTEVRRHAAAADLFARALGISPNHAPALGGLAVACSGMGQHARAIKVAREGVAASPGTAWNHYVLGWVLSASGQHRKAIVNLDRAVSMAPMVHTFWSERAHCKYSVNDFWGAQQDAEKALEMEPQSADALNALGLALYYGGTPRRGLEALRRCRAIHPADARTHANLGWCLASSGQHEEAYQSFRRALELRPGEQRWVAPLIQNARRRLWWFNTLRSMSRHVLPMAIVIVVGFMAAIVFISDTGPFARRPHEATIFCWAAIAMTTSAALALTLLRSLLGALVGCLNAQLSRFTPREARAAGGAAVAVLSAQLALLFVATLLLTSGLAWLSALALPALVVVYATQRPIEDRRWLEVVACLAAIGWIAFGFTGGSTRLWAIAGALLLGLVAMRLERLRRYFLPPAGVPSLH